MAGKKKEQESGKEKRRGHGEGSWQYLDDLDKWKFRVSAKDPDGLTQRFAVTAATKTECRELAKARAGEIEKGIGLNIDTKNITVGEYLDRWVVDYIDPVRSISTRSNYRSRIKQQLSQEIGKLPLKKLQRPAIQRYFNALAKTGISTATVRQAFLVLHSALKQACDDKIIAFNPAAGVRISKVVNKERVTYSTAEVQKILQAASNHPHRVGYHLLFSLALRVGEMLGLRWVNVELPEQGEGKVHIVEQLSRAGKDNYAGLKTKGSERTLPVSPELASELRLQKLRQREALLKLGLTWSESLPVLSNSIGRPVKHDSFLYEYSLLTKSLGLQTTGTHDARHTRLTLMGNSAMDAKTLSRFAGHSDVAFTLNVYVTPSNEAAAAAVKQIDKAIYQTK